MRSLSLGILAWIATCASASYAFDLQFTIGSSGSLQFTPAQVQILNTALSQVESMWETVIVGYRPGINVPTLPITVLPTTSGLAAATYTGTVFQGGFQVSTAGYIEVNVNQIADFANWQGPGANGLNYVDEILAHETGHVLGIGTQWLSNGVYIQNSFHYTGQYGVAAFQSEFNQPNATFVPVENAGGSGTPNAHWDQLMRSSVQEGNPNDPYSLNPRIGITDQYGRDLGLELMSGAIDPDQGEPFISRTTVESLRDLGYEVTSFEDFNGDGIVDQNDLNILNANLGATGLGINSMCFGDANRDRKVDMQDFALWQAAAVPEPAAALLGAIAVAAVTIFGLKCHPRQQRR